MLFVYFNKTEKGTKTQGTTEGENRGRMKTKERNAINKPITRNISDVLHTSYTQRYTQWYQRAAHASQKPCLIIFNLYNAR